MVGLFHPAGLIAVQERTLIVNALLLMLIVVVPVFALAFSFAWRYREGNTKAAYNPEWEHSKMDELVWWAVPLEIILVLAALCWQSSHALDPHKALASDRGPLVVEVIALQWKWLFIYPAQGVATENYLELPVGTPVSFKITSDAPMNSFWIPQLGGQMYAMTGMVTPLNLLATQAGDYPGYSANYSGEEFSQMQFTAHAVSEDEFNAWVAQAKLSTTTLNAQSYSALTQPSPGNTATFSSVPSNLFETVTDKYLPPPGSEGSHH